jgi:hypothetical protein
LKESKSYQKSAARIIETLEERVDPFDLDVFSPYMMSHLMKQGQRSTVRKLHISMFVLQAYNVKLIRYRCAFRLFSGIQAKKVRNSKKKIKELKKINTVP